MNTDAATNEKVKPGKGPGKYYRNHISLTELFRMFPDERTAEAWFEKERWGETGLYCPRCGGCDRVKEAPKRRPMPFWCGDCRRHFSVRIGTVMERSKIPLNKWAIAIFQYLSNLKGVSSMKLHNDLGITQKTAWFMLHRIRMAYESTSPIKMTGPVEIDESHFGGKEKNKHAKKEALRRARYRWEDGRRRNPGPPDERDPGRRCGRYHGRYPSGFCPGTREA